MTEADWESCNDPDPMLKFLAANGKASDRKARLFAVACCRRIWPYLKDERSRRLTEVAEAFADGAASPMQLRAAFERAAEAREAIHWEGGGAVEQSAAEAVLGLREELQLGQVFEGIEEAVGEARAGQAWARIYQTPGKDYRAQEAKHRQECDAGAAAERQVQAELLRDLFGNPFRQRPPSDDSPITGGDSTTSKLAQAAYGDRLLPFGTLDTARLAVLADALEEGGCTDADLLGHLRTPGLHVRGCWVLDAVLDKS